MANPFKCWISYWRRIASFPHIDNDVPCPVDFEFNLIIAIRYISWPQHNINLEISLVNYHARSNNYGTKIYFLQKGANLRGSYNLPVCQKYKI